MSRRVTLPGAAELFRTTGTGPDQGEGEPTRSLAVAPHVRSTSSGGLNEPAEVPEPRSSSVRQTRPRPQRTPMCAA